MPCVQGEIMIVETGFIVFLSLIVIVFRMPKIWLLKLFGRPWLLEVPFGILAYVLHYGTFSGMMAAAVAAILVFGFCQAGRIFIGYIIDGYYYPGMYNIVQGDKHGST
jgi:hypothetical protein